MLHLPRIHRPLLLTALVALPLLAGACAKGPATHAASAAPAKATQPAAVAVAPSAIGDDDVSLHDLSAEWRDQHGEPLRLADLEGTLRVVSMVYTHCQATCPLIVGDLKRIESAIPATRRDDVRFVLVSLDPARDTPGRLLAWAAATRLDAGRWTLLNGSDDAVREVAATLGVRYRPHASGALAHTNVITVLDRGGRIVHQQIGLGAEATGTVAAVLALLR